MAQQTIYNFDCSEFKKGVKDIIVKHPIINERIANFYNLKNSNNQVLKTASSNLNRHIDKIVYATLDDSISTLMEWTKASDTTSPIVDSLLDTLVKDLDFKLGDVTMQNLVISISSEISYMFFAFRDLLNVVMTDVTVVTSNELGVSLSDVLIKTWDMWTFDIKGNTVSLMNNGDYRIFDWTEKPKQYDPLIEDLLKRFSVPVEQQNDLFDELKLMIENRLAFKPV